MLTPAALTRLANALGGLPILGCDDGSPAARAGARYGDIVLSVDGVPTASWADFFQARKQGSGLLALRVLRQGRQLELALALPAATRTPREVLDRAPTLQPGAAGECWS